MTYQFVVWEFVVKVTLRVQPCKLDAMTWRSVFFAAAKLALLGQACQFRGEACLIDPTI